MTDLIGETVSVERYAGYEDGHVESCTFYGVVRAVGDRTIIVLVTNSGDAPVAHRQLVAIDMFSKFFRVSMVETMPLSNKGLEP